MDAPFVETFAPLSALPEIVHGFIGRVPGIDVQVDREAALARLAGEQQRRRDALGLHAHVFATCEQTHGADVAVVDSTTAFPVPQVDGLITADPRVALGIYVADCCAIYLVDPARRVLALLHSGRKGTERGIAAAAIGRMREEFGCEPADIVAQLSPCIRPPDFEVDFAAAIVAQCRAAGLRQVFDCGISTATHLDRYYSYRIERGKTGRMLALLALRE